MMGSIQVVEFHGRLTFGQASESRYAELRDHINSGDRHIILDLGRVSDVDSAGLGFLVMCFTSVRRAGGELRLAAPSPRVVHALSLTRLDTVFPVFPTTEDARREWPAGY